MSKIDLQDFVEIGKLFEAYGSLLSQDRQKIMNSYFNFNMTLAEIAKEKAISRQAVLDAIDKSCEKLKEYENVLKVKSKSDMLSKELQDIKKIALENGQELIAEKVDELLRKV